MLGQEIELLARTTLEPRTSLILVFSDSILTSPCLYRPNLDQLKTGPDLHPPSPPPTHIPPSPSHTPIPISISFPIPMVLIENRLVNTLGHLDLQPQQGRTSPSSTIHPIGEVLTSQCQPVENFTERVSG